MKILFGNAQLLFLQLYMTLSEISQNGVENQDGVFLLFIFLRPPPLTLPYMPLREIYLKEIKKKKRK
jgi:hypothetical protein